MVRLKVRTALEAETLSIFQFHYGTIKSGGQRKVLWLVVHFNSTMVRLKVFGNDGLGGKIAFQFHYGTIKSSPLVEVKPERPYFNSTMVRLKASH